MIVLEKIEVSFIKKILLDKNHSKYFDKNGNLN